MDTLQSVKDYLASLPLAAKIAGSVCAGVVTIWILKRSKGKRRVTYPRDTIILHQPFYGPYQLVPFALKLETYLRIVKVPYQIVVSDKPGPKGKFPWIEYNDKVMGDSSFIIKFVNETFNVDLDKGFSKGELGAAHALQKMLEENTYWSMVLHRWVFDKKMKAYQVFDIPFYAYPIVIFGKRNILKTTYAHGIGRHTREEILAITVEDLTAVSNVLGNKKFLLGDRPCQADCAIFGQLSEFYWHSFGNECEKAFKEFPNLAEYCDRIVSSYWPDWQDLKAQHTYKLQ